LDLRPTRLCQDVAGLFKRCRGVYRPCEISNKGQRAGFSSVSTARAIQLLVLFSVVLGVLFLAQAYTLVPAAVFDFVGVGWVLFVLDLALTFTRPRLSYYLAFALALLALASSLPQTAHYAFIEEGDVLPAATFLLGSALQVLLVILVPYHFLKQRRRGV